MKHRIVLILAIVVVIVGTVGFNAFFASKDDDFLTLYGLDGMSVKDIVGHLENKLDEPVGFKASITGSQLVLGDASHQLALELPSGQFYLSFAPYIQQTHPCAIHNLVSCRGELKQEIFEVRVLDVQTHQVVFEGQMTSNANGFAGIWLPKDKTYQLEISYGALSASHQVSTFATSDTCLTTLKLT